MLKSVDCNMSRDQTELWAWTIGIWWPLQYRVHPKSNVNPSPTKSILPIAFHHSPFMPFFNFAQSTAAMLLCSLQNYKMIGHVEWILWMTELLQDFSFRWSFSITTASWTHPIEHITQLSLSQTTWQINWIWSVPNSITSHGMQWNPSDQHGQHVMSSFHGATGHTQDQWLDHQTLGTVNLHRYTAQVPVEPLLKRDIKETEMGLINEICCINATCIEINRAN